MDSLSKQASIPAGIHRPFFTCYLVALDLLPRPLSPPATTRSNTVSAAFPPFSCPNVFTLDIDNALFNSCGFSLLGYVLPPPFLEPPPPLSASTVGPVPSGPKARSCLQSCCPVLLWHVSSSADPVPTRILMSSRSFCFFLDALLRVFERPVHLHSLEIFCPCPHPRANRSFRRCSGRPLPHSVLKFYINWIVVFSKVPSLVTHKHISFL